MNQHDELDILRRKNVVQVCQQEEDEEADWEEYHIHQSVCRQNRRHRNGRHAADQRFESRQGPLRVSDGDHRGQRPEYPARAAGGGSGGGHRDDPRLPVPVVVEASPDGQGHREISGRLEKGAPVTNAKETAKIRNRLRHAARAVRPIAHAGSRSGSFLFRVGKTDPYWRNIYVIYMLLNLSLYVY